MLSGFLIAVVPMGGEAPLIAAVQASHAMWFTPLVAKVKDRVLLPARYAQPNTKVQLTHWPACSQNLGL